jgi:hypothetical protein
VPAAAPSSRFGDEPGEPPRRAGICAHLLPQLNRLYGVYAGNFNVPPDPAEAIPHGKMTSFGDPLPR